MYRPTIKIKILAAAALTIPSVASATCVQECFGPSYFLGYGTVTYSELDSSDYGNSRDGAEHFALNDCANRFFDGSSCQHEMKGGYEIVSDLGGAWSYSCRARVCEVGGIVKVDPGSLPISITAAATTALGAVYGGITGIELVNATHIDDAECWNEWEVSILRPNDETAIVAVDAETGEVRLPVPEAD